MPRQTRSSILRGFGLSLGLLLAGAARADWSLDTEASSVQFISTKNNAIAEVHSFKQLSGSVDASGMASVEIALDSVDTLIPIRDERMREHLFNTVSFPTAVIGTKVDVAMLEKMPAGSEETISATLGVSLHGMEVKVPASLRVSAMGNGRYAVTTVQPLLLRAAEFDLVAGLAKLQEIAGLDSISTAVPVIVHLVWNS